MFSHFIYLCFICVHGTRPSVAKFQSRLAAQTASPFRGAWGNPSNTMSALTDWENFYIIVGPSAGALIGLQFIVLTLIADMPADSTDMEVSGVFTTPSVIHFSTVLFLSAIVSIPWGSLIAVAVVWGLIGLIGMGYVILVTRRLQRQKAYEPVFEDWLFHVLLPLAAYVMMVLSASVARSHEKCALFGLGAAALLLLFTGIHNAWDLVTHLIFVRRRREEGQSDEKK